MAHSEKQQITIFPTNRCNMNCSYCVASKSIQELHSKEIDIDFAKAGIQDYFSQGHHQIRFYSNGEPTCGMDVIKECVKYGRELIEKRKKRDVHAKSLITEIQTNCFFDEVTAVWIGENIDYVWASIDGWPDVQDKYRRPKSNKGSSEKVLKNIEIIRDIKEKEQKKTGKDTFIGVRSTIVNETVDRQEELVEYFAKIGIKEICSEPCFRPVDYPQENNQKITLVDLGKYVQNFISAWKRAQELEVSYINSFIVNFGNDKGVNTKYACRACLPTPHLTVDGCVSACDLAFHAKTSLPHLIYGKWDFETKQIQYDNQAIEKLRDRHCNKISKCNGCIIQTHCCGGCLGRAYHETGDFYGVIKEYCDATRYLYEHLDLGKVKFLHLHP